MMDLEVRKALALAWVLSWRGTLPPGITKDGYDRRLADPDAYSWDEGQLAKAVRILRGNDNKKRLWDILKQREW